MRSKHQNYSLMLLFAIPVLLFLSCGKDSEVFTPYEPTGNIEDYYSTQGIDTQIFERTASDDIIIVTENNTIIAIPSYSMIDDVGNIISDGIKIEVIEVFDKADMVLHQTSTMTRKAYLESNGMFHIRASKDGKDLKMKDGYNYKLYVPHKEPDPEMKLFYGDRVNGMVVWEEAEEQDIRVNEWQIADSSTVYFDFGYELFCDKFTWINIDKYYDIPEDQKTSVCVSLPEELYNQKNTAVFMIYKEDYSLIPFTFNKDDKQWCEPYAQVPKGWEVIIISISSLGDDEYHLGYLEATITENNLFTIIPKIKTKEEIKDFLDSL